MTKSKKVYVIQGNYGKWEDVTYEGTLKDAKQMLKDYNENEKQYDHRIIVHTEKIIDNPICADRTCEIQAHQHSWMSN